MADNYTFTPGTGGSAAADDIGGVLYPRAKISLGADGTANDAVDGAGTVGPGVQRVTHADDDPAVTALQVVDDWDESDRAKVNIIVGQAGVAAGAGSVGANVQRITHASDDPVTTSVQIMDDWDESDRAKVNLIVGQAGVAAGSGTIDATVQRMTLASNDSVVTSLEKISASEYETVAASQTAQTLGPTGATGDYLAGILVIPANTSPGNVIILDNATSITVFVGGTSSVSNLVPFFVPLGMTSVSGAWKITTGADVSCIGIGNFT